MVFTTLLIPFLLNNLYLVIPLVVAAVFIRNPYRPTKVAGLLQRAGISNRATKKLSVGKYPRKKSLRVNASQEEEQDQKPALDHNLAHIPFNHTRHSHQEMIQRSEEFYQELNKRRTMRFYSEEMVPKEVVENIIRAAGTSPSGAHTEPWSYVVISDIDLKLKVREIVEREEMINYTQRMGDKWTTDLKPLMTDWNKPYLTEAPYLVLLFKQVHGYLQDGGKKVHYYNEISCSISAGLFIAAAQQAGLCTLTSTPLNCGPALRSLVNRPDHEKLLMLLPLGVAASTATVPQLQRKPLEEFCVFH